MSFLDRVERVELEAAQARLIADLIAETGQPFQRPQKLVADYKSVRGLPTVGPRGNVARAVAGVQAIDQAERSRIASARQRSGSSARVATTNDLLNRAGNRCYLCGCRITIMDLHLEHVIPLALGGTDTDENLSVACGPCNMRKGSRFVAHMVATRKPIFL